MTYIIDWNEIWKLAHSIQPSTSDPWVSRAEHFNKHVERVSKNTDKIITQFNCKPTDTVLDIGAGPGRYVIPLASQVASVTAIEPSYAMRQILESKVEKNELTNVVTVPLIWEDITIGKEIEAHDIVIVSHSLTMHDLKEALIKINQAAKRDVWIFLFAGNRIDSWIRDVLIKAGKPALSLQDSFDYLIVYSVLHDLEIYADINIHTYSYTDTYPDAESALRDWRLLYDISPDNEIFTQEITRRFTRTGDQYSLPRTSRTAAIHWRVNSDSHLD